jgi:hypothetical protein
MKPTDKAAEARFWDRYIEVLNDAAVPEKSRRWYVVRIERYISAHPGRLLRTHSAAEVEAYLTHAGRDTDMQGWVFRQLVHALQLLFIKLLKAGWAQDFDWQYWLASANGLELSHPTIARHNSPMTVTAPPPHIRSDNQAAVPWRENLVAEIRRRNYSIRTEEAYTGWVQRFLKYCQCDTPIQLGGEHVAAYLNYLAVSREVSASTQNVALNALVFLYQEVLRMPLGELAGLVAAKRPQRLPSVLTRDEIKQLIAKTDDATFSLIVKLMYGTGMRLMECVRMRAKDRRAV